MSVFDQTLQTYTKDKLLHLKTNECKTPYYCERLKGKPTTFHVDVQSMLMVILVNWSNKFLSLCYTDRESWVLWVCPAHTAVLQCLHVPGCIASQKNRTCRVSKVIICIRNISFIIYCVVFNNEGILVLQSQKILSKQTWRWLACSVRGKARGEQFVVLSGTSDVTDSRENKRFWSCVPETQRTLKNNSAVSHYIPNFEIEMRLKIGRVLRAFNQNEVQAKEKVNF